MPKAIAITAIRKPGANIPAGKEFDATDKEIKELIAKGAARLPDPEPEPEPDDDEDSQKTTGKQAPKSGTTGSK